MQKKKSLSVDSHYDDDYAQVLSSLKDLITNRKKDDM